MEQETVGHYILHTVCVAICGGLCVKLLKQKPTVHKPAVDKQKQVDDDDSDSDDDDSKSHYNGVVQCRLCP